MNYYKTELEKINTKGEFSPTFQISSNGERTKVLNLNEESAKVLIEFLEKNYTKTHKITRDGDTKFIGSENECYFYLQRSQSQSADWAIKNGGWKIEELGN